ncbi:B12-binding domain-containing radical SAM protein [Desulfotomaculum copahuensis]|uniref:Uncharacterized protein n=1 Tax=Desulfotomaculum copahuensis TaxID=1838280 RepID=A0A1B7LG59_9FIRM|nr:radical SAM protein [Desulfotomaculum copahuensis]OAT83615.1 hypothetical protein A6M21_07995 [Desulfotomaculum copahuensis]
MSVLLIQPPEPQPAVPMGGYGLSCVAAYLEDITPVRILDACDGTIEGVLAEVEEFAPDMAGITLLSAPSVYRILELARRIKDCRPGIEVVLGGNTATFIPEYLLQSGAIDYVVRGEGELTARELIQRASPVGVKGVSYLEKGRVVHNPPRELIADLNEKRPPARHLMDNSRKLVHIVESSRGCVYQCVYCTASSFYGHTWRKRSPENVVREIKQLMDFYAPLFVFFADDSIAIDVPRLRRICELIIEEGLQNTNYMVQARTDAFERDPELAAVMARAGVRCVLLGIESGNQDSLNSMKKGNLVEKNNRAVEMLRRQNIFIWGYFIIGTENESPQAAWQTFEYAKSLKIDSPVFSLFTPLPGTRLYSRAKEENSLITDDYRAYDCHHVVTKNMPLEMEEICRRMNKEYFFRREYLEEHMRPQPGAEMNALLAKIFWTAALNTGNIRPSSFQDWQAMLGGYASLAREFLTSRFAGYNATVAIELPAGIPCRLRIVNGELREVEPGEEAEVIVRGNESAMMQMLAAMTLEPLSACLAGEVNVSGPLEQVLDWLEWCSALQAEVALDPVAAVETEGSPAVQQFNRLVQEGEALPAELTSVVIRFGRHQLLVDLRQGLVTGIGPVRENTPGDRELAVDAAEFSSWLNGGMERLVAYVASSLGGRV